MATLPEPDWTSSLSTIVDSEDSPFCSATHLALLLTGALIGILRTQFGNKETIADPILKQDAFFTQKTDCTTQPPSPAPADPYPEKTGISIGSAFETANKPFPRIAVKRDSLTLRPPRSVNDGVTTIGGTSSEAQRQVQYAEFEGSHTITISSTNSVEAEILAVEVFHRLTRYMSIFVQDLKLSAFRPRNVSPVSKSDGEGKDLYICTITVAWIYAERSEIVPIEPLIKRATVVQRLH